MEYDVPSLLKVHDYFRGVEDAVLAEVVRHSRVTHHQTGEMIVDVSDPVDTVGFVLAGRVKGVKVDAHDRETPFYVLNRGDQFGLMVGALAEPSPLRLVALEPTTVLALNHEQAMDLAMRFPDLRRAWLRTYAGGLKRFHFGATTKRAPMVLVLVHETPTTTAAARRLIDRLTGLGEQLGVFTDSPNWTPGPGERVRSLPPDGQMVDTAAVRAQAAEWGDVTRIVFDVAGTPRPELLERLLSLADRVLWFIPRANAAASLYRLRSLGVAARGWREKVDVVWLLPADDPLAPAPTGMSELSGRSFTVVEGRHAPPWGLSLENGIERLVHHLRGVRIGVALGGGAARGMAHLGVLKALERNGIVVDMIAGTSAGAMTGTVYASGLDGDWSAAQFSSALRPSWAFRMLPGGDQWYLLSKYRLGHFDRMLRRYLHDWRLEQLATPCLSVTVDLVAGEPVVRDSGDAVHAILESINLPVLAPPILRGGRALVDGGLVNNVPADVLVSRGCNFVIAVSVVSTLGKEFCGLSPGKIAGGQRPGTIATLLRSFEVLTHNMNARGSNPADVTINPDLTTFDLTAFTRATEMAAVGERATQEQVGAIRQLLHRLDPKLFPLADVVGPPPAASGG